MASYWGGLVVYLTLSTTQFKIWITADSSVFAPFDRLLANSLMRGLSACTSGVTLRNLFSFWSISFNGNSAALTNSLRLIFIATANLPFISAFLLILSHVTLVNLFPKLSVSASTEDGFGLYARL